MSDEGDFKFAGGYVELNVKDNTGPQVDKAIADIESKSDVDVKLGVDGRSVEDTSAKVKEDATRIGDESPVKVKVELDDRSVAEFEAKVKAVTDKAAASSSAGGGGGIGTGGLIAGGIALGAGPLAGAALLAIPAIFGAIGVAAEKGNADVQTATAGMVTAARSAVQQGFAPMVPAIVAVENQAKTAVTGLAPVFGQVATAASPLLVTLGSGLLKSVQEGVGASVPLLRSMQPEAQALADGFGQLERGVMGFFSAIDPSTAAQGLSVLFGDVEQLLPAVGGLFNAVMPLGNALLSTLVPAVTNSVDAVAAMRPVFEGAGAVISFLGPDISTFTPYVLGLVGATKLLTGSWLDFPAAGAKVKSVFQDANGEFDRGRSSLDSLAKVMGITTESSAKAAAADLRLAVTKANVVKAAAEEAAIEAGLAALHDRSAEAALAESAADETLAAASKAAASAEAELAAAGEAASFSFGPLGIALGGLALLALPFIGSLTSSSQAAANLSGQLGKLEQAAGSSSALQKVFQSDPNAKATVDLLRQYGVTVQDLAGANNGNAASLAKVADASKQAKDAADAKYAADRKNLDSLDGQVASTKRFGAATGDEADEVRKATDRLNESTTARDHANQVYADAKAAQDAYNAAQAKAADVTHVTADTQRDATAVATALGVSVTEVEQAWQGYDAATTFAMTPTQAITDKILGQQIAVAQAKQNITTYFQQAAQAADQAGHSLDDANHSYEQSIRAVADARHSEAQAGLAVAAANQGVITAQRGVTDAMANVVIAQNNVTKAEVADEAAQRNLNAARQTAIEQLKTMHLQLADQATSEVSARLALADQIKASAAFGVTTDNAAAIDKLPITIDNEPRVKAANDLLKAEQSLADTLNTGANLRTQVAAADKAGVEGSNAVVAAKNAVASANDQVTSAAQSLIKAQQSESDAEGAVVKARQGVTDALYAEDKAHQAVKDALYAEGKAWQAVGQAQQALSKAQDDASHSMDINTAAGLRNQATFKQLYDQLLTNEPAQQAGNDLIQKTADLFHISTTQAQNYLTQIQAIPADFRFSITGVADADLTAIDGIYGRRYVGTQPNRRGLPGFAEGGLFRGAGGPREDANLARVSDGEFWVNAAATARHLPLLNAINSGQLKGFADGGLVTPVDKALDLDSFGTGYQVGVDLLTVLGLPHPPGLPAYVPPAFGYGTFTGSPNLEGWIQAAINRTGVGQSWDGPLHVLIGRESSGNPNAINLSDTNAARGDPSRGLMQTIGATFESNRDPGLPDNIYDPVANIVAGIHYIERRYGSIFNVQQANPNLPPKGYDAGGYVMPGQDTLVRNQTSQPEMLLPPEQGRDLRRIVERGAGVTHHWHIAPVVKTDAPSAVAAKIAGEVHWRLTTMVGG